MGFSRTSAYPTKGRSLLRRECHKAVVLYQQLPPSRWELRGISHSVAAPQSASPPLPWSPHSTWEALPCTRVVPAVGVVPWLSHRPSSPNPTNRLRFPPV